MIRNTLRRFFQGWERHPWLFAVPAGAAVAWTWIRFSLPGLLLSVGFALGCLIVAVRAASQADDDEW